MLRAIRIVIPVFKSWGVFTDVICWIRKEMIMLVKMRVRCPRSSMKDLWMALARIEPNTPEQLIISVVSS